MRRTNLTGLALLFVLLLASVVVAQTEQQRSVVSSGGATITSPSSRVVSTVGQPAIGKITSDGTWHNAGFLIPLDDPLTGVPDLPTEYRLRQNFPNPFNPMTTIRFDLPESGPVRLEVFGIDGRRIAVLLDEVVAAGYREVIWRGEDNHGRRVASGTYFYRLHAGGFTATQRLMLVK